MTLYCCHTVGYTIFVHSEPYPPIEEFSQNHNGYQSNRLIGYNHTIIISKTLRTLLPKPHGNCSFYNGLMLANDHSVRSLTHIVSVGVSDTIGNNGKNCIHF